MVFCFFVFRVGSALVELWGVLEVIFLLVFGRRIFIESFGRSFVFVGRFWLIGVWWVVGVFGVLFRLVSVLGVVVFL